MTRLRDRLRQEDGWAGTAIAYPAVVIFCLALFQFGFYYLAQNVAEAVADNAYQQARAYQATTSDGVDAGQAALTANGPLLGNGHVDVRRGPETVTVTVTGHAFIMLPGLTLPAIRKSLTGPVERWIPPA